MKTKPRHEFVKLFKLSQWNQNHIGNVGFLKSLLFENNILLYINIRFLHFNNGLFIYLRKTILNDLVDN